MTDTALLAAIKKDVEKNIRAGRQEDLIRRLITNSEEYKDHASKEVLESLVDQILNDYPSYPMIKVVLRSKIVQNVEDGETYLFDPTCNKVTKVKLSVIRDLFGRNAPDIIAPRTMVGSFVYRPYDYAPIIAQGDYVEFNTYVPPDWLKPMFFSGGDVKLEPTDNLPEIYDKFFIHLVDGKRESYNYLLDWLANAIQKRNLCYLVLIGEQGVGKGVLSAIMEQLVGPENFQKDIGLRVAEKFNSHIAYKRIVNIDEFSITSTAQEEKVKDLINPKIPIEQKGKDIKMVDNYASFYFSSNSMDAIKPAASDRRFSILDLTEKSLLSAFDTKFVSMLLSKENVEQLARFLFYRPIDQERMTRVFTSQRTEIIKESGLKDWEEFFLQEVCWKHAGEILPVQEVSKMITRKFGETSWNPGRPAFERLRARFPGKFAVTKHAMSESEPRVSVIKFKTKEEQLFLENSQNNKDVSNEQSDSRS